MDIIPKDKLLIINQIRDEAGVDAQGRSYTHSKLYVPTPVIDPSMCVVGSEFYGHVLEDAERPPGIKVHGETAIPCGTYFADVTHSPRFNRDMIMLSSLPRSSTCQYEGITFSGIRIHGGNRVDDTEGCPLLADNYHGNGVIQGASDRALMAQIKICIDAGYTILWVISRIHYN